MVTLTLNVATLYVTILIYILYYYFPFTNVALNPEVHMQETAFSIQLNQRCHPPPKNPPHIFFMLRVF